MYFYDVWKQGLQGQQLEEVSNLAIRVIRLFTYSQLARGQSQLHAIGAKINLTAPYVRLMKIQRFELLPKKQGIFESSNNLKIHEDKDNTF